MHPDEHGNEHGNEHGKDPEKHVGNSPGITAGPRIISYNVPEGERPGGIKVRYKIRVATGKRAREIDKRQARVIMEVLRWRRQNSRQS